MMLSSIRYRITGTADACFYFMDMSIVHKFLKWKFCSLLSEKYVLRLEISCTFGVLQ